MDNFPVSPIENNCSLIIGSFVNQIGYVEKFSGLVSLAERTFMVGLSRDIHEKSKKFDLVFAPSELKNYKVLNTLKASELFEVGFNATRKKLKEDAVKKVIEEKISL
jgi:NTE family protein